MSADAHAATPAVVEADEAMHPVDPDDWSWNESWFFSWIDTVGGPAGFFLVGVLPNQGRAILWMFVHVDGQWVGLEESRLAFGDVNLDTGVAYDKWALHFAWRPDPPLHGARFTFVGEALVRSGPNVGAYVPISIALECRATARAVPTGTGDDDRQSPYPASRFEQPVEVTGALIVDGRPHEVAGGGQRDRSWGPREWRQRFTLGDLQAPGRQLYFVGRTFPGLGMGFLRKGGDLQHLMVVDGRIDFDDDARTVGSAWLRMEGEGSAAIEVGMRPVAPAVVFDMAHTCEVPERWLYWRTLVEAEVTGWDRPCRGWFETSRYGVR